MKLFKKSTISLALTAAMASGALMGVSAPANAVSVAEDGLGDAMVFPYYTVRDGWSTFFNLTNTSNATVFVKVRWNEGENSRDARDFNVILSPYDVWTAATVSSVNGGARIITTDNSCTSPALPDTGNGTHGVDFTNAAYIGINADTGNTGVDRNSEGYFTVFEMGVIDPDNPAYPLTPLSISLENAAKHNNVGNNTAVPANCAFIDNQFATAVANISSAVSEPQNVLKGRAVVINFGTGVAAGYDPVTMANFFSPNGIDTFDANDLIRQASTTEPNMNNANPAIASFVDATGAVANLNTVGLTNGLNRPVDAVSTLLNRVSVIDDYNVANGSDTAWVLTFPTKGFYVDEGAGNFFKLAPGSGAPISPFSAAEVGGERFGQAAPGRPGEACVNIRLRLFDREEFEAPEDTITSNFSPLPPNPTTPQLRLCKEANILSFGESNTFGSLSADAATATANGTNRGLKTTIGAAALPGDNGWGRLSFNGPTGMENPLPVTGFRMETRKNATSPAASFGFANDHAYQRQ